MYESVLMGDYIMACLRLHVNSNQCKQTTTAFRREDRRFRRADAKSNFAETECRDTGIRTDGLINYL